MAKYSEIIDDYPALRKRLEEHRRMYAALLEIKRLFEKENGKFKERIIGVADPVGQQRHVWNIACRGIGK